MEWITMADRNPLRHLETFAHAFRGIASMVATEPNARVHALATIVVVLGGVFMGVSRMEWLALTLAIGAVWAFEAMNTAVEALCDLVSPDFHPQVKRAKDVAAGAVLLAALTAIVVAVLVFGSRLA